MNLSVIGTGSWGVALANTAADKCDVKILARREEIVTEINETKSLEKLFPKEKLNFSATTSVEEINNFSNNVLIVVPMKFIKNYCLELKAKGLNPQNIISASKGFDKQTLKTGSQILKEIWPNANIAVLSGPSHAESLIKKAYTSVMIASKNKEVLNTCKSIFKTNYFNLYKTDDVFGVELYGAAKNVYSIGAGMTDALAFLDNTKAAYITRVMAELSRLGKEFNVDSETIYSLAGLGDLLVTSYSINSRNYKYGRYLVTKDEKHKPHQTVEGLNTLESIHKLMKKKNVRMPILQGLYNIIINKKSIQEEIMNLMQGANNE